MSILNTFVLEEVYPGYGRVEYHGLRLVVRMSDNYVLAPSIVSSCETTKEYHDWKRQKGTEKIMQGLSAKLGQPAESLEDCQMGLAKEIRGTYIHPFLVTLFAMWIDFQFYLNVVLTLEQVAKREHMAQLAEKDAKASISITTRTRRFGSVCISQVTDPIFLSQYDHQQAILEEIKANSQKQLVELSESRAQINAQSVQIAELLGYAKDTKTTLERTEVTLERTESKLDTVVECVRTASADIDVVNDRVCFLSFHVCIVCTAGPPGSVDFLEKPHHF